jgi:hypothetical protein
LTVSNAEHAERAQSANTEGKRSGDTREKGGKKGMNRERKREKKAAAAAVIKKLFVDQGTGQVAGKQSER